MKEHTYDVEDLEAPYQLAVGVARIAYAELKADCAEQGLTEAADLAGRAIGVIEEVRGMAGAHDHAVEGKPRVDKPRNKVIKAIAGLGPLLAAEAVARRSKHRAVAATALVWVQANDDFGDAYEVADQGAALVQGFASPDAAKLREIPAIDELIEQLTEGLAELEAALDAERPGSRAKLRALRKQAHRLAVMAVWSAASSTVDDPEQREKALKRWVETQREEGARRRRGRSGGGEGTK